MSSGASALKLEGPVAQKGSIALEVTMATLRYAITCQPLQTKKPPCTSLPACLPGAQPLNCWHCLEVNLA